MNSEENNYKFKNSESWIKYTHERYLNKEEIKRRLYAQAASPGWDEVWDKISSTRKAEGIDISLPSIEKNFWYYPTDSIQKKIIEIERYGVMLYEKIIQGTFRSAFLSDALIEEAISSAIYEGANSTRAQAEELIQSGKRAATKDDWMLLNNLEALNWIKEHTGEKVSLDLILKVHQIVSRNTLDLADENYSGRFRDDKVFVRNAKGEAVHEGVEYNKIEKALNEAIEITTNNPRYLHPLIKGTLFHYLVAFIHPFFDGNGRTARTMFYFKSMKHDLKFVELLSISAHLKKSGNSYERVFETIKEHDWDLTYFINYSLESLLSALKIVEGKVNYLMSVNSLRVKYNFNDNQISLLQKLALQKYRAITIESYASEISKSREISRKELKELVGIGFLIERKVGKKFVYTVDAKFLKGEVGG